MPAAKPGCNEEAGAFVPVVDPARCEGKEDCVRVCPYDVFEIGRLDDVTYRALPLLGRLKARVHGMKTSRPVRADDCHACGLCVKACPEDAIRLARRSR